MKDFPKKNVQELVLCQYMSNRKMYRLNFLPSLDSGGYNSISLLKLFKPRLLDTIAYKANESEVGWLGEF